MTLQRRDQPISPEPPRTSGSDHPAGSGDYLPLFVYGTLLSGMANFNEYLEDAVASRIPATIRGCLYLVEEEGYPYLVDGDDTIRGELVHLKKDRFAETLARIDRLEEYDVHNIATSVYIRKRCQVAAGNGPTVEAWAYYWNLQERPGQVLTSGDFRNKSPNQRPE